MKLVLAILFTIQNVFAAADSPSALVPAFINFGILFLLLGWKLRKPLTGYFTTKSDEIKSILERANVKAKEAEMMMQMQKKKIDGMKSEIETIKSDANKQVTEFKSKYSNEIDERIVKLKEDANSKVEAERKEQLNDLNESILNNVISKTKAILKNDKGLADSATKKLLEGIK